MSHVQCWPQTDDGGDDDDDDEADEEQVQAENGEG